MSLSFYYQNVRGLRTKTHTVNLNLPGCDYDVICLTETWLNDSFTDAEISNDDYLLFRKDRNYDSSETIYGGGCLIAVRKGIRAQRIMNFETELDFLEDIWVKITLPNEHQIYICTTYISPFASNQYLYEEHLEKITDVIVNLDISSSIFVIGDYNCPSIKWSTSNSTDLNPYGSTSRVGNDLIDVISLLNLKQFNPFANDSGNILDLALTNVDMDKIKIRLNDFPLVDMDVAHPTFEFTFDCCNPYLKTQFKPKPNFWKGDYDSINLALVNQDWSFLDTDPLNEVIHRFYSIINSLINTHIPLTKKRSDYPQWYSFDLVNLIKEKNKLRLRHKKSGSSESYSKFSELRMKCKRETSKCYKAYLESIQETIPENIKKFWAFSKKHRQTNSYPPEFKHEGRVANNSDDICELFSEFFRGSYDPRGNDVFDASAINNKRHSVFHSLVVSEDDVKMALNQVDINKKGGPDGIPNVFLRKTCENIASPLTKIFNRSLSEGMCPLAFKEAFITPIFKKGNKSEISNYRPVCLLNAFAKLFERLVHNYLSGYIKGRIDNNQHGFFKNRSTLTNLLDFTQFISSSLEDSSEVHAIYTDFSKAFDKVNINVLLSKLKSYGIQGAMFEWFKSYLSGRKLYMVFNESRCNGFSPGSGVPQGSILGPLLFLIFINDLGSELKSNYLMFADDLKIYRKIKTVLDCVELQRDLITLQNWCDRNSLHLNISKCQFISFSTKRMPIDFSYVLNNTELKRVYEIKDLGVTFDSKLRFDIHIRNIVAKSYRNLGFVMRLTKEFTKIKCMKFLYYTLVMSNLEYNSQIWSPLYTRYVEQIERVQRKFTRFLCFKVKIPKLSYDSRLKNFGLTSLELRRKVNDMMAFYKIVSNKLDVDLLHLINIRVMQFNGRFTTSFEIVRFRTNIGGHTNPLVRFQRIFNKQFNELDIFYLSLSQFRLAVCEILQNTC